MRGGAHPTFGRVVTGSPNAAPGPYVGDMRFEASVTSLSWIPSEAIPGTMKLPFEAGFTHYDQPPPDVLDDLDALREADRFRFANHLRAFVEIKGGEIVRHGYLGGGSMGSTTVRVGKVASHEFQAFQMPDIQRPVEVGDGWVRFVQTAGGRTGLPAPRRVRRKPFIQWQAPLVWATLALTLHADERAEFEVLGASRFPRHWIYGPDGRLAMKSGLTDFKDWYRKAFGKHSPWGDEDSPALVTAAESALERALSSQLMRSGTKPSIKKMKEGATIVAQGDPGGDVFLILDGVVRAEVGGERMAEYGPGALLGERAVIEGGTRTATLVAVTPCRLAVARGDQLDPAALEEVSRGHRHEERR
jgi:hypothetical protein